MEYQKIINLLDNTTNQPPEFRTRNSVEIHDDSQGKYNVGNQIEFKTSMIRLNLCNYIEAYIHGKGTVSNTGTAAAPNNRNKNMLFKNCAPFTKLNE